MAAKRPNEDGDEGFGTPAKRQQLDVGSRLPLPNLVDCGPWEPSDVADGCGSLPPLPRPANSTLETQAFAHRNFSAEFNYEELEWLGDAWIQVLSSNFIYATFGRTLKVGRLSQLRELIVRNKTLAKYFRDYGWEARAKIPQEVMDALEPKEKEKRRTKDAMRTHEKIQGDMFEAYVGAIVVADPENGGKIIADWLKALWARELQDELRKLFKKASQAPDSTSTTTATTTAAASNAAEAPPTPTPDLNPKVQLSRAIVCRAVTLEYKDMPGKSKVDKMGHPIFAVGLYLSGWGARNELLAVGSALKKSEAGSKAAELALLNKKIMNKYIEKKQAFLKARGEAGGDP